MSAGNNKISLVRITNKVAIIVAVVLSLTGTLHAQHQHAESIRLADAKERSFLMTWKGMTDEIEKCNLDVRLTVDAVRLEECYALFQRTQDLAESLTNDKPFYLNDKEL